MPRNCLIKFVANRDSQQIMRSDSTDGCKAPYLHGVEAPENFCHHLSSHKSFTKQNEISVNSHSITPFMKLIIFFKKNPYNPK